MKKINFFRLFLFVLLFSSAAVNGQWINVSTAGIESTCNVNRVFADGNDLYAYVINSGLYKSTDGGDNWAFFNTGLPASVEIRAIATNDTKIYVAANKNGIYSSEKASATFSKLGTVPVLTNDFSALVINKDTLYLGINGKGVYKCIIPTTTYTQLTSGLANNAAVMSLAFDSIVGVGKRLYAGVAANNGLYVKNLANDTWVQKTINAETVSGNMFQVRAMYANNGKIIMGGNSLVRGLVFVGTTTDFSTYNFVKADTSLVSSTINAVEFDGQRIYLTATNGVWKSTDIASGVIRYSQLQNGLQTPRGNTAKIAITSNGKICVAQVTGAYLSTDNGATWTRKLNEKFTNTTINGLKENAGKLYALTSSGIYESASGNGGDWVKFGTGLNSNVVALVFGSLGTYSTSDGALFKLNGTAWEAITIDQPGWAYDHPRGSQITDIEQFNDGTKNCLFGSGWRSSGIYRYDGTNWDLYTTTTVNDEQDVMTGDADNGLTLSIANDSSQSVIGGRFLYDAASNTLMSFGKNTIQYSFDFGNSWKWRMQGYNVRLNQGNLRGVSLKKSGTQSFVYAGTDMTFGGAWSMGKTEIGTTPENVGGNWVDLSAVSGSSEVRDVLTWDNSPLLIVRTAAPAIRISTDDGATNKVFETAIMTKSNITSISKIGNFAYLGSNTNAIQRYDVAAVPAFVADVPAVTNISASGASIESTTSVAGTIYAVVLAKNATTPSATQIVAGKDAADASALAAVNVVAAANVKSTANVSSLSESTDYTLHMVAVSETGVRSTVTSIDFKTSLATGLNNLKNTISVSPNPTKGILKFNQTVNTYKVYTLQGVEVLSAKGEVNQIDLSSQPNGIYLLKVENSFVKVIKE
jgi:hypothetical protein